MVIRVLFLLVLFGVLAGVWVLFVSAPPKGPSPARRLPTPALQPFPTDLPRPSADLPPAEVVRTIVAALRDNDSPVPQAGVATTFNFASPENQQITGPLDRFIDMLSSDAYSPMLNHRRAVFGRLTQDGPRARQLVTLYGSGPEPAYFLFVLVRQPEGDLVGCWLTDGVLRLTAEQAAEERRKDPTRDL